MSRVFKTVCLLLSLALNAAAESRPETQLQGRPGRGDILLEHFSFAGLRWEPLVGFDRADLRIAGRQGLVWRREFEASEPLYYDLRDLDRAPLPDGAYTYELRLWTIPEEPDRFDTRRVQSGRFRIQDGVAQSLAKLPPKRDFPLLTNPFGNHFEGNLTTDAELCVGCVDGAYAGVTDNTGIQQAVIRAKADTPGMILQEGSGASKEYWRLNSYLGSFLVEDLPTGTETEWTTPFTIESQAPSNSLYVSSSGEIGLGTAVPQGDLHIYKSSPGSPFPYYPNIVFEFDEFPTTQAFRMASDDSLWGVVDVTAGDILRLAVEAESGDVCVGEGYGCFERDVQLHVSSVNGKAQVLVEEQSITTAVRTQFQLWNNGAPRFALRNTNSDIEWSFQQSGPGNFLISREGTGGPEMQVYQNGRVRMGPAGTANFDLAPTGNLTIKGSLTANGSTFPDYVFEPGYDLMPLSDLRKHIEQNRRLPNIPSAEEVKKQGGHNMTELQLKLLEKIEELTLYTLEQQERLQKQEEKLSEVEALKQTNAQLQAELAEIRAMLSDR